MTRVLIALGALLIVCANAGQASAQSYPNQAIRLVVPFPAGGGVDTMARILANKLTDFVKQPDSG